MALLIALVLGLLSLVFVLYPLFSHPTNHEQDKHTDPLVTAQGTTERSSLTEREQAARDALQEVELDYQLGNIAEPDYNILRERYMKRALVALKSRYEREQELDDVIEEQLRKMKQQDNEVDDAHQ
jgi:hypothetical protein